MTKNHLTDKYTMGFDLWGLLLFAVIMLPNILWMFFPAPNDLLRAESVTPVVDGIASFCQMLMVFCLCLIIRRDAHPLRLSPILVCVCACVLGYWLAWGCYYAGLAVLPAVLLMTLLPCAAFLLYLWMRGNLIGLIPAIVFTVCHIIFAFCNFLKLG